MAKVVTDDRHYKAIADVLRTGPANSDKEFRPEDMAGAVKATMDKIYSYGFEDGERLAFERGIEQGKQAEYDRFWDAFQQNGRDDVDMRYMFYGWTDEAYNPKYPIRSSYSTISAIFRAAAITSTIVDVDFSLTQVCSQAFYNATALVAIPKLIVCEANTFANAFDNCSALVDIAVEGKFGQNINVQWSAALSKASITGIINALSGSASGKSVTLSKEAVDNAFTAEEWATLAATKTNWTINLV